MEPPLTPPEPLLCCRADLSLFVTYGSSDDIIGSIEDLGWHWQSSMRDNDVIHHSFSMDEVYSDDAEMIHDFLYGQIKATVSADRLVDIEMSMVI